MSKEWRAANREHVAAYQKKYNEKWYRENTEKYLIYSVRARAKKLGLPFDLVDADVTIPDVCPVLGIPLVRNTGRHGPSSNSPSVDRIIPEKGYVKTNIQVISHKANTMKNNASPEELKAFANWVNQSIL